MAVPRTRRRGWRRQRRAGQGRWPDELAAKSVWIGSGLRARPGRKDRICFSRNIFFSAKTNSGNNRKFLQGTKNTPKIPKIVGKFPDVDWSMNNPNKVFGAHEKDFIDF
jgi:hypothetical protein